MSAQAHDYSDYESKFVRTTFGRGLHLPECPHVHDCVVHPATPEELASIPVCEWSQNELDGVGRRYFESLDEAMRDFGSPVATQGRVRELLRGVAFDQVWVPNSSSYIAVARGGLVIAWIGMTYMGFRGGRFETFPGYAPGGGGGAPRDEVVGEVCDIHFLARGLNGACDGCE